MERIRIGVPALGDATKHSRPLSANSISWLAIAIATALIALVVVVAKRDDAEISADDLRGNSFAFGVLESESTDEIRFAGSPTIDLAPTPEGVLHGQVRIPFASVPDFSETGRSEPVFLFALPRDAEIDVLPFIKSTYTQDEALDGRWWGCKSEDDVFSGDVAALGKYYADLVRVDCTFDGIALLVIFPPGGLEASASEAEQVGSLTSLKWAPTIDFRVQQYAGITSPGDESEYLISLDPNVLARGGTRPAYDSLPNGLRPVLALTPWSREIALAPSTPATLQLPHYGGFGAGTSSLTEIESAERPTYLSGRVSAKDPGFVAALKESALFVFLLGLLAGQAQPALRWLIERTTQNVEKS